MVTLSRTGNSEIDEQHTIIQDCLSDLKRLVSGPYDPGALLGSLETLTSYAEWHFTFEERLLERSKYPDRIKHIAEHRAIVGQLNSLRSKVGAGNRIALNLISAISHWIVEHANNEDIKSAQHLAISQACAA